MKDPEFIDMRNKFLITLLVVGIFSLTLFFFLYRLSGVSSSAIYKKVINKDTFIMLVVDKDCTKCNAVRNILDDNDIKYFVLDRYKDNKTKLIYERIDLDEEINSPCLIYVKRGKVDTYADSISNKGVIKDFMNSVE